jgi:hypothetical protein
MGGVQGPVQVSRARKLFVENIDHMETTNKKYYDNFAGLNFFLQFRPLKGKSHELRES